jgi:hypothetical protein
MYAAEEGKVPGVSPKVGADFINASHGLKGLPERVRPGLKKIGRVSHA